MSSNLKHIVLLCSDTVRTRIYLGLLSDFRGGKVTVLEYGLTSSKQSSLIPPKDINLRQAHKYACMSTSDLVREKCDFDHLKLKCESANDTQVLDTLSSLRPDLIIYSGTPGEILYSCHFKQGFSFLHMHPGKLPEYRGSTTIYYSILNEKKCHVTAFLMTAKIDHGEIVRIDEYELPRHLEDIDILYDAAIRGQTMVKAIYDFFNLKTETISYETGDLYFVIHPVLKHLAMLTLEDK